jgi:hypothetical protein
VSDFEKQVKEIEAAEEPRKRRGPKR